MLWRPVACIGWALGGCGLWKRLFWRPFKKSEAAVLYTVHPAFYLWPLIIAGLLGAFCVRRGIGSVDSWGWAYLWVVIFTLVTLLFDLSLARLAFWTGVYALIWVSSRYLEDLKQVPVVTDVLRFFHDLHPRFDAGHALALSTLLAPAWIGSLVHSFFEGKKTFTPNSIEERYVGHGCEISDRAGLKFRVRYRDLFESLLGFGAADLEAMDAQGKVVKRWSNIVFLAFTWRKLDEILHQRAAVVDNAADDPVEVEEVHVIKRV
ncbi:MAG: hypothetical protein H7144_16300 [Burkholderiales bacterium]|nr:hypothetical protein [Phycisphaerae bacterium]